MRNRVAATAYRETGRRAASRPSPPPFFPVSSRYAVREVPTHFAHRVRRRAWRPDPAPGAGPGLLACDLADCHGPPRGGAEVPEAGAGGHEDRVGAALEVVPGAAG